MGYGGRGSKAENRWAGAWVSGAPQLGVGLVAGCRAHPEVS